MMPYVSAVYMAGGKPVRIPTDAKNGFRPPIDEIRKNLTSKSRIFILNNPSNPTGVVFSDQEITELAEIARSHDLIVISDEVYRHLIYDDQKHQSIVNQAGMRERTILVNSFSKSYAIP